MVCSEEHFLGSHGRCVLWAHKSHTCSWACPWSLALHTVLTDIPDVRSLHIDTHATTQMCLPHTCAQTCLTCILSMHSRPHSCVTLPRHLLKTIGTGSCLSIPAIPIKAHGLWPLPYPTCIQRCCPMDGLGPAAGGDAPSPLHLSSLLLPSPSYHPSPLLPLTLLLTLPLLSPLQSSLTPRDLTPSHHPHPLFFCPILPFHPFSPHLTRLFLFPLPLSPHLPSLSHIYPSPIPLHLSHLPQPSLPFPHPAFSAAGRGAPIYLLRHELCCSVAATGRGPKLGSPSQAQPP